MITTWMAYTLAITTGSALAGIASERLLRQRGLPSRWAITAAIVAALAVPAGALWLVAGSSGSSVAVGSALSVSGSDPTPTTIAVALGWVDLSSLLGWAWLFTSTVLLFGLGAGWWRLRRSLAACTVERVAGEPVWISEDLGPAVTGGLRRGIVLPRWLLSEDRNTVETVLAHERAHLEAHDPELVFACALPAILMPWNLALWWLLGRLRLAVEADCDRRVMRQRGLGVQEYGRLLVDIGERGAGWSFAITGFSEQTTDLERRLERIMERPSKKRTWTVAGLGFVAGSLATAVFLMPRPEVAPAIPRLGDDGEVLERIVIPPPLDESATRAPVGPARTDNGDGPVFVPMTVRPEVRNVSEVIQAMTREYPETLRSAGIGGRVVVWFFIDAEGMVQDTRIAESSGHAALDDAAINVASVYRFSPALNRDEKVPVWVQFPITFQVR